jgi:peptidoglycan/xylan/chitin deacetylase (PgdA/CDA1 family)
MKLAISFDYDSPEGFRRSFGMQKMSPDADQRGTDLLLGVLSKHGVRTTFGVVGRAALDGPPPEHCPAQIRAIHAAGHEVASHSMHHLFLPPLRRDELFEEAAASRRALEDCIGAPVRGFIPPFNRPMHFPQRRAFSVSETLGLHGRGRGRQSVGSMLRVLGEAGYGWSRVSFEDKLARLLGGSKPEQPFVYGRVVAIPLHCTGFAESARALVRRYLDSDMVINLYGHPSQALEEREQSAGALDGLLEAFGSERRQGRLKILTMAEVEEQVHSEPRTGVHANVR